MKSFLFPDVNVWLALSHSRHVHHGIALEWFGSEDDAVFCFCRFTQIGLLRMLTNTQIMGDEVLTQKRAWDVYSRWAEDDRIEFHREPEGPEFDRLFRRYSMRAQPSSKLWAHAYLAAFAKAGGLKLATFDRAFKSLDDLQAIVLPAGK